MAYTQIQGTRGWNLWESLATFPQTMTDGETHFYTATQDTYALREMKWVSPNNVYLSNLLIQF